MALGRPPKFNEKLTEKMCSLFELGKTTEEVGEITGISPRTIYLWQRQHPEFLHAVKEAKQIADELVEASLFHRAIGYSVPEEKVFCSEGQIITHKQIKHYPPDMTAAIFWLKNRKPKEWRDKTEVEQTSYQIIATEDKEYLLEKIMLARKETQDERSQKKQCVDSE